ncbi:Uncharacterised protein [Neisseria meningitidis]|nr:Uncharacterised protein [Neisseria meningitidis]
MMGMLKVLSDTSIRPTLEKKKKKKKWESRISGFQSFPIDSRRVVPYARPASVNGECIKNAV